MQLKHCIAALLSKLSSLLESGRFCLSKQLFCNKLKNVQTFSQK